MEDIGLRVRILPAADNTRLTMRRTLALVLLIISLLGIAGCAASRLAQPNPIQGSYEIETQPVDTSNYTYGETVYVPVYSSIFYDDSSHTYDLTATLSVRNVDTEKSIVLVRADYYNTNGDLLKSYIADGLRLKPFQTVHIVINESDKSGGTGANFVVQWVSRSTANSPIVEAVMISTRAQQGISFTTTGRVIGSLGQ